MLQSKQKRPSWEDVYLDVARTIAKRSKDPRTQVGAVLVKDKSIFAVGYNAEPRNSTLAFDWFSEEKYTYVIHAEMNALANAARLSVSCEGADIYVTHAPCPNCLNALIQNGVKRVFYNKPHTDFEISKKIAEHSDIELIQRCHLSNQDDT